MSARLREDLTGGTVQKAIPIPPLSVVRLASADKRTPGWHEDVGRIFRVGYYGRNDGLDCIWLVNDEGIYEQTTDHAFLYRYFDVIHFAKESDLYGLRRPRIPPIRQADLKRSGRKSRRRN
ncbi:MAG: hypothetical protein ABSE45_03540 [Candidatus Acidiferrales bacterium]